TLSASACDKILWKQAQYEIIDLNVNHHVHAHDLAVVLDRVHFGKIAVPEFTRVPRHLLAINDEDHVGMRDDRNVQAQESKLKAGVEIEVVLDVSARR